MSRARINHSVVCTALILFAWFALGCGATSPSRRIASSGPTAPGSAPVTTAPLLTSSSEDHDGDSDLKAYPNAPPGLYDPDDAPTRYFGHAANATDRHLIASLVGGYYRAIARGDGASVCSALEARLARTLGSASAAAGAPHGGCAAIVPRLFKNLPGRPRAGFARVAVVGARVMGERALALLRLPTGDSAYLELGREHGEWKLAALLDVRSG